METLLTTRDTTSFLNSRTLCAPAAGLSVCRARHPSRSSLTAALKRRGQCLWVSVLQTRNSWKAYSPACSQGAAIFETVSAVSKAGKPNITFTHSCVYPEPAVGRDAQALDADAVFICMHLPHRQLLFLKRESYVCSKALLGREQQGFMQALCRDAVTFSCPGEGL